MEASRSSGRPVGGQNSAWIGFAGIIMVILGSLDAFWGLAAVLNNEVILVGGHGVILADITTWGWIQMILGALVGLTGIGLLVGNQCGRRPDRRQARGNSGNAIRSQPGQQLPQYSGQRHRGRLRRMERPWRSFPDAAEAAPVRDTLLYPRSRRSSD